MGAEEVAVEEEEIGWEAATTLWASVQEEEEEVAAFSRRLAVFIRDTTGTLKNAEKGPCTGKIRLSR